MIAKKYKTLRRTFSFEKDKIYLRENLFSILTVSQCFRRKVCYKCFPLPIIHFSPLRFTISKLALTSSFTSIFYLSLSLPYLLSYCETGAFEVVAGGWMHDLTSCWYLWVYWFPRHTATRAASANAKEENSPSCLTSDLWSWWTKHCCKINMCALCTTFAPTQLITLDE